MKYIHLLLGALLFPFSSYAYSHLSPYSYCGGNPVDCVDPTGCIIEGVTKKDAALAVEDFKAMFPGEKFANFRNLIVRSGKKHKGKSLAMISEEALAEAFSGINLNEDQQALVEMVVNTINSTYLHKVEYLEPTGNMSYSAEKALLPKLEGDKWPVSDILDVNRGLPVVIVKTIGKGGITIDLGDKTYSLIFKDPSFHINGRPVTTGHEIIGHGRSLSIGRRDPHQQHVDAVQTENLILRVMGIPYINTGADHIEGGAFPGCSLLPGFR